MLKKRIPFTMQVPVPPDIPMGAMIGKKGCIPKAIQETHRIRVFVDVEQRSVVLAWSKHGVEDARFQVLRLIENRQASLTLRLLQHWHPFPIPKQSSQSLAVSRNNNRCGDIQDLSRHNALQDANCCLWFFDLVSPDTVPDPAASMFPYLLCRLSTLERADSVR